MNIKKYAQIIQKYLSDSNYRFLLNAGFGKYNDLSDKEYLERKFKCCMGKSLNLENPQTFNEKLQWLKLYNRKPEYTMMVDKYKVRDYIAKKLGSEYLVPLIGVWDDPDDIDFDKLPNQFVLKCNHNSGLGMCICKDKSKLNIDSVKKELRKGLKQDYYLTEREWAYKNVQRKIVCEQFMIDKANPSGLIDYKFYCFNGEPKYLYVSENLDNHDKARISFATLDYEFAPFGRDDYKSFEKLPPKPINFEPMKEFARALAKDIAFLRVDFYEINDRVYFGELTFYPCAGLMPFNPPEWDLTLGLQLELPNSTF